MNYRFFRDFLPYLALLFIINHSLSKEFFDFALDFCNDNSEEVD